MSQISDEKHARLQQEYADQSQCHHSESSWGSIPGGVMGRGKLVTQCCLVPPFSVYVHDGVRSGSCPKCGKYSQIEIV